MSSVRARLPVRRRSADRAGTAARAAGAVGLAILLSAPSCGAVDDLARGLRTTADDVDSLAASRWMPEDVPPPPAAAASSDEVAAEANRLAQPLERVPEGSRKEVVEFACEAVDYADAVDGDLDDAYAYLATHLPNSYSYRVQVEELAQDLADAGSTFEMRVLLGRAALCQWATA